MSGCTFSLTTFICTLRCTPTYNSETCYSFLTFTNFVSNICRGPSCLLKHVLKFQVWNENMKCYFSLLFWTFPESSQWQLIDHTGDSFQEEISQIVSILVCSFTQTRIILIITHLLLFSNFSYCSHTLIYQVSNSSGT